MKKNYNLDPNTTEKYLKSFKNKNILVLGDLMLDKYLWGHVDRISPEAPVPILDVDRQEHRLGGAANVVNNILSLGAMPIVIGLVGDDGFGREMDSLFTKNKVDTSYIVKDPARLTTVKTRLFASGQQILRYDHETSVDISKSIENKIIKKIEDALTRADALIIEDYNKGLLTPKIIEFAIKTANKQKISVLVDPKYKNFFTYKNCTVFKPNLTELQKNLRVEIHNDNDLLKAAQRLFKEINPKYLIITLSEKGLIIFDKDSNIIKIPTFAREIYDVSGAGDTVISTLTLCLASGVDIKTSAIIANHAAGAVCGKLGIQAVTVSDILTSIKINNLG